MSYIATLISQRDFFNTNSTKDISFRIEQLKKLKSILKSHESDLCNAIYSDFKKSEFETYTTELGLIYVSIDDAVKNLPKWARRKRVKTNIINLPGSSYIIPEPLGVSLIIGAWNYPFLLSIAPAVASISAGNTVIIKPSEIAKSSSAAIAKMIKENFPSNYFTVIEGGIAETTELLSLKFDKIFFTGSTSVGKIVYQAAAKYLTPVTLELGGKSPAIITRNCDLKKAAKRIIWAKFLNAGQTCISPDYVLVDVSVKTELLEYLKEYIIKFDYSFENNNYVQIVNEQNFHRLVELINKNKIYFGGELNSEKRFISPTLLTDISFEDEVMKDEIFGPILPVILYSNLNEAIVKIKSLPKPLACYIFTNNKNIRNKLLNELSFGGGAINDAIMHISNTNLPFGGVGDSGMGSYNSETGFATFSHFKSILDKPFWLEPNLKYSPITEKKLSFIKRLMRW